MFNLKKEILEFNHKKQCGLWLILIGIVLIISIICGGKFFVNPFVFLIGYYACFFGVNVNKRVREKLSQGNISKYDLFFDCCIIHIDVLYCWSIYPWMALETDMVGCADGNINTFLLVVLYTWLEYDSARKCMYNYRNNRLYVSKYTSFSYLHCRCDS